MITSHRNGRHISVLLAARGINPLSRLFQRELAALLDKLEAQRPQPAAVLIGFDAGPADRGHEREHLLALTPAQAADCMHMLDAYNALLRRLENLELPVTATLGGEISGHAFGLALACHRRVASRDARVSLPQVLHGLAPAGGEIVRSVRLAGLRAAMPLLLEGAALSAVQALRAGLLHAIADDEAELDHVVLNKATLARPWQARGYRPPGGALDSAPVRALLQTAPARLKSPAAAAVLCAMVEGLQVDFDTALTIESRYFCQTAISQARQKGGFSF